MQKCIYTVFSSVLLILIETQLLNYRVYSNFIYKKTKCRVKVLKSFGKVSTCCRKVCVIIFFRIMCLITCGFSEGALHSWGQ